MRAEGDFDAGGFEGLERAAVGGAGGDVEEVEVLAGDVGFIKADALAALDVFFDDLINGADVVDAAALHEDAVGAEGLDGGHGVGDEEDSAAAAVGDILHFADALALELGIADREDFIDNEDFGVEVGGDGEGESDAHAGGVAFDGGVEEFFDFGEGDDVVELAFDLEAGHAEDGAPVHVDVFAAGQIGVEAGANFEEGGDAAVNGDAAGGGGGDAGEDFEEGGFAGAVAADDADAVTGVDFEGDIVEGPEGVFA